MNKNKHAIEYLRSEKKQTTVNEKIDAVIMFVDMSDEIWLNNYNNYIKEYDIPLPEINNVEVRSRDYGTLRCLLRSIEKNAEWINNVFLVVQLESQVPKWVNRETVKIVLHEDFIPNKFLPLYNTFSIQAHLHLIPGLSERFLCISDDSIISQKMLPEDFFIGNKIVQPIRELPVDLLKTSSSKASHYFKIGASEVAKQVCNINNDFYYMDEHGIRAMFKTVMSDLYSLIEIEKHISSFRDKGNIFMNTFVAYAWLTRKVICVPERVAYIDFKNVDINKYRKWLNINQFKEQLSINDQDLNPIFDKELFYKMVEETLYWLFPEKSKKYEL